MRPIKMHWQKMALVCMLGLLFLIAKAQHKQQIIVADYEDKPNTQNWWKDNGRVQFMYDERTEKQINDKSKACLYVKWDSISENRPYAWFTDLKADTFAVDGMEERWKLFKEDTWLSFWCKAGEGDTLMLHYLVLSKGHKKKWGANVMVPVISKEWKFYKVRFADLTYEEWGVERAPFNLNTDQGLCFEVGLRLAATQSKGFVEAWFDNLKLTNYEPNE